MDNRPEIRNKDLLYPDESYKIVAACREVYKQFGGAFKESVVDKALTIALEKQGLQVESQKRIDIYFEGAKVGTYVPDKVGNEAILVEVKNKPFITKADEKQFWYYFKATSYKLGFLINFDPEKLEIRRRIYDLARNK
ncbi:MAG: GxxExxY protein [Candidatus Doudnabacteria bacterium]|nr:GxxExxY protein [Candidatus Doudnabacteria bacterium]